MGSCWVFFSILGVFSVLCVAENRDSYLKRRRDVFESETNQRLGADEELTEDEERVNHYLMQLKEAEIAVATEPFGNFWPSVHFFHAKPHIEQSPVFKIIKRMPKGM